MPKNTDDPEGDDSLGMLDDTPSSDTTGLGLLGGTAQVSVSLPTDEDDDLADDEVIDGEIVSDLIIDTSAVADEVTIARISRDTPDIVIELPADELPARPEPEAEVDEVTDAPEGDATAELVEEIVVEAELDESEAGESPVEESEAVAPDAEPETAEAAADSPQLTHIETAVAAAKAELREAMSPQAKAPAKKAPARRPAAEKKPAGEKKPAVAEKPSAAEKPATTASVEKATPAAASEQENLPVNDPILTSKRLDDLGDAARESADLLTPDRLLDPSRVAKPEPEGTWSHLLYSLSGGRINVGDSRKARERKQLTARIAAPLAGTARFVPVLSRKGGVGKTTVTALLGMALADARDDRVIAVDANPDRGTLAERVVGTPAKSVRDLVRAQQSIRGFHDISALVARDETRLDVLASDSDPRVAEAFGDEGYRDVATVAAQYYSLVLTDSGTGIVHSVMSATLDLADQLVIVSGLSVDEARLASETITWLESNGHSDLARNAIVVLNQSAPGAPMVRLGELEAHFSTRARSVLRIPYDPQIAGGGAIDFASLQPETRRAARELAAALVEGLRARAA